MEDSKVLEQMRADWNARAGEDAYYYVAFGRRHQEDDEFFSTGNEIVRGFELELKRLPGRDAALEIGCGPGRLMRPLARHFTEIHGVDVSDEMIKLARERLSDTPNATPHLGTGSDLGIFPDEKFDFVYSYAVFQHIPSREVVFHYLKEARRVLKIGGVIRCQLNGLPPHARQYDTWSGVRIAPDEIRQFAIEQDLQLLAMEQIWTQYTWITCRKLPAGWRQARALQSVEPSIRSINNALTGEAVAPVSGPLAALSLWIHALPADCDLLNTRVLVEGLEGRITYIGEPQPDGISQLNVALPEGLRTGMVQVEVESDGRPLCPAGWVRIMPAGPSVPRISTVTDGINLVSGNRISTRTVKVTMTEVADAKGFSARVDGMEAGQADAFCADPVTQRWEFNFKLPPRINLGYHEVEVRLGKRVLPPVGIEVVSS
jgi:ubiquinone/menaquinone biosynthesis C-methylase UbiE